MSTSIDTGEAEVADPILTRLAELRLGWMTAYGIHTTLKALAAFDAETEFEARWRRR